MKPESYKQTEEALGDQAQANTVRECVEEETLKLGAFITPILVTEIPDIQS